MKTPQSTKRLVLAGFLFIVFLFASFFILIKQMNQMIYSTTLNTVQEIAAHDRISIENYTDRNWTELEDVYKRIVTYNCDTISAVQEQMSLERSAGDFHTLYLIAEDGSVYTDRYMIYTRAEKDMQSYLNSGEKRIACRYDYTLVSNEKKEMILYAVSLDHYQVEDVRFTYLLGIAPINAIQKRIVTYSFLKDGRYRGYTNLVDLDGNYIVNTDRTVILNRRNNLYELLSGGNRDPVWSDSRIHDSMEAEESFQITYTDAEGIRKFLFFTPVNGVSWYLLTSVEQSVFTELSQTFIFSCVSMVLIALVLAACMLLMFMRSHKSAINANAAAKARSEFLSNMSHEIRTPLNGITGLLYLMETHLKDGDMEQMLTWIQKSRSTAQYLFSLVSDILDVSKLEAGKLTLNMSPFMLDTMLNSIATMQSDNIKSHGVELIVRKDIPYPCIIGDEMRVKQVLMNIVGNAAKFTPGGGTIRLSAHQVLETDGRVATTISCADTGVGMTQEFLKHIWDSFSQEQNKVSDGTRGTGLGMAISKKIIDAMNGEISVESELGKGSTFTVTIHSEIGEMHSPPCTEPESAENINEHLNQSHGSPMKLLIAEDNELNAEILLEILQDEGYELDWARDGRMAADIFEQSNPGEFDAILMDMQMPVMDGCQATKVIRGMNRADAKSVVIFACTANSFQKDVDRALASGMNDFLSKPIDIDELLTKLTAQQKKKKRD